MREGAATTIPQPSTYDAPLPEMTGSSGLFAPRSMAIVGGHQRGAGRTQRSSGINPRTALLSLLAAAPLAMAQSCIPLAGSRQCSAFQSSSISVDSTLVGFLYVVYFWRARSQLTSTQTAHFSSLCQTEKLLTSSCSLT